MDKIVVEIITEPAEMLKCLMESHNSGTMIGITSIELGPETYITAVRDILIDEDDPIIVVKGYDRNGYFFSKDTLRLKEISSVIPFASIFDNPFLRGVKKELEMIRNHKERNTGVKANDYID